MELSFLGYQAKPIGLGCNVGLFATFHCHHFCHQLRQTILIKCGALTKQTHRFLTTLTTTSLTRDESATNRLLKKFVASSPKSVTLNTLSHLLSPDVTDPRLSSLALPLYYRITEASWFTWNSKLVAELVALLNKHGQYNESETLISETVSKIGSRERELVLFYSQLNESHSKHSSISGFETSYTYLSQLLDSSTSVYVKHRAYESMVSGLCVMGRPHEAENLVEDMRAKGVKPSRFEFRSIIHAYGRLGFFSDMNSSVKQMEDDGFAIDTTCCNMALSSLGSYNELGEMVYWLQRMNNSCIPFSIRTYNSVLKSCPIIASMLQDMTNCPISIEELSRGLSGDEAQLVNELVGSSVLEEVMVWGPQEVKLDLHGLHLGAAYLILLQWVKEIRQNFSGNCEKIPSEFTLVCGSGNHSNVRGEPVLKVLVKDVMARMSSPMRVDRKNQGCFVAKGQAVRNWLC